MYKICIKEHVWNTRCNERIIWLKLKNDILVLYALPIVNCIVYIVNLYYINRYSEVLTINIDLGLLPSILVDLESI